LKVALIVNGTPGDLKYIKQTTNNLESHLYNNTEYIVHNEELLDRATLPNLLSTMNLDKDVEEFLFYYVGHGEINHTDDKFELQITDIQKDNIENIISIIRDKVNPRKTFMIIDACYSGKILEDLHSSVMNNVYLLSSCSKTQMSYECDKLESTRFSYYFSQALEQSSGQVCFNKMVELVQKSFEQHADSCERQNVEKLDQNSIGSTIVKTIIKETPIPVGQEIYLTIEITPVDKTFYNIAIWIESEDETILEVSNDDIDENYTKDKIAQRVYDHICTDDRLKDIEETKIILLFILPSNLMAENVHFWTYTRKDDVREKKYFLGNKYRILLRGLERVRSRKKGAEESSLASWKSNWNKFDSASNISLVMKSIPDIRNECFIQSIEVADKPFLVLKYPPVQDSFLNLYDLNVPIAMWINNCRDYTTFDRVIDENKTMDTNDLHKNLHLLKSEDIDIEATIMLIYDNPNKLLPDEQELQIQAPQ